MLFLYNISIAEKIIFFTDSSSIVSRDFSKYISDIQSIGEELDLEVKGYYSKDSLPQDVRALPSIYYIKKNGEPCYYKGRYSEINRFKTFIINQRTFSFNTNSSLNKEDVFYYEKNGFQIGLIVKIKGFNGDTDFDEEKIKSEVNNYLKSSFTLFEYKEKQSFENQSKLFYLNIYPYVTKKGIYFTTETFSQHSCKESIASNFDKPYFNKKTELSVKNIARKFEDSLNGFLETTNFGDGLHIVKNNANLKWEDFGVVTQSKTVANNKGLSFVPMKNYFLDELNSQVAFSFMPPVSQYAGTIRKPSGEFVVSEKSTKANVSVSLVNFDMGEEVLNHSVLEEQLLIATFPDIKLNIDFPVGQIPFYETIPISGELSLLGIKQKVVIEALFSDNEKSVLVNASFELDISAFETLEQPDAPEPFNKTLFINFIGVFNPVE